MPDCCYDYRYENAQPKKITICDICGEPIHEGDSYYDIENTVICDSCINDFKKTAEEDND